MYYVKLNGTRLNIFEDSEGGIDLRKEGELTLSFINDGFEFSFIKELFSNIDEIIIYGCIEQNDGTETDEYVARSFDVYTQLSNVAYNLDNDIYRVTLLHPNETEARLSELEDAVNFLVMGGNE